MQREISRDVSGSHRTQREREFPRRDGLPFRADDDGGTEIKRLGRGHSPEGNNTGRVERLSERASNGGKKGGHTRQTCPRKHDELTTKL